MGKVSRRRRHSSTRQASLAVLLGVVAGSFGSSSELLSSEVPKPADVAQRAPVAGQSMSIKEASRLQTTAIRDARSLVVPPMSSNLADLNAIGSALELQSAERVQLRVSGFPDLSVEYRINPDQTISIAGLRRVPVDAMSVPDLEKYLSERLSATMRRDVSVSVEISRFKPYFVTGLVGSPGAVEWRPGQTLIQAISLAGGVTSSPQRGGMDSPERGLIIEQARAQLKFALAQLARLKAEKEGKSSVESSRVLAIPGDVPTAESKQALATFIERQNQLLAEQRDIMRGRITRLERERELAAREFETARQQEQEIAKQLDISKEMSGALERLKDEKLITVPRYLGQQRDLIESRVRFGESRALVERARARVAALTREIESVQQERRAFLNDRIEVLEREIAQLELTLQDARATGRATSSDVAPTLAYYIARKQAASAQSVSTGRAMAETQTMAAHLFTEILPGDVIIISSQARTTGAGEASMSPHAVLANGLASPVDRVHQIMETSGSSRTELFDTRSIRTSGPRDTRQNSWNK